MTILIKIDLIFIVGLKLIWVDDNLAQMYDIKIVFLQNFYRMCFLIYAYYNNWF